jgi:release factor H-coupled RctB family protein
MNTLTETNVRLFASAKSWIEGEALRQLFAISKLEGMRLAVGFPDLHPGKAGPVGVAFVTEGLIYPSVIGGDIGCGMALFKTDLVRRDAKLDRWAQIPFDLEHPWTDEIEAVLTKEALESTEFDDSLGTLGGGNHFAELQAVEEVVNTGAFKKIGLSKQQLVLLIHSGSRGLGESVLRDYIAEHQASGSDPESFAGVAYLHDHDLAVRWAKVNRKLLAERFAQALGAEARLVWDGCHNSITPSPGLPATLSHPMGEGSQVAASAPLAHRIRAGLGVRAWVHRKGAVVAADKAVMIPGSRGSLSYLIKPLGDGESRAWSLAHGAGRKWARSEARLRMRERFRKEQLVQTNLGSRVICGQRDLLYEEAPAAYKNIEAVIQDLVDAGLVSVIATFRPLLTYKTKARDYTG